eukprot:scaffold824_cov327-Pavlova_lutheri.AAC.16
MRPWDAWIRPTVRCVRTGHGGSLRRTWQVCSWASGWAWIARSTAVALGCTDPIPDPSLRRAVVARPRRRKGPEPPRFPFPLVSSRLVPNHRAFLHLAWDPPRPSPSLVRRREETPLPSTPPSVFLVCFYVRS